MSVYKKSHYLLILLSAVFLTFLFAFSASAAETGEAAADNTTGNISEPEVKKGLVPDTNNRYRYYLDNGEILRSSWKTVNGKKYWFNKNGDSALPGAVKVKGKYYLFLEDSSLCKPSKQCIKSVHDKSYFVSTKGIVTTGWFVYKGKLYYAPSKNPALKTSGSCLGITFKKDGSAKDSIYTKAKKKAITIVNSITKPSMTKSEKLRACWRYVVGRTHYAATYPNLGQRGWQQSLAYRVLTNHAGNCYGFACAFAALAAEVGYDPYLLCGRIPGTRDQAADGMTRHCWVRINGRHYDPEGAYAGFAHAYGSGGYPMSHSISRVVNYKDFI